jgi:hypothetical protein
MECGYKMTEINMIRLGCVIHTGQVYWLVLIDTQESVGILIMLLLGVTKIMISKQQLLSFME